MLLHRIFTSLSITFFWGVCCSAHADLILSNTNILHAQFSALLPPFVTWKNRDETLNLPFSIGSTTNQPVELSTRVSPACPKNVSNEYAACMANTSDHSSVIQYTIKYIPCGAIKPFYLSSRNNPSTTITLESQYTAWSKCQAEPGLISLTRLSLFEQPLPSSGLYQAQILLELREI